MVHGITHSALARRDPFLERLNVPTAVVGGVLVGGGLAPSVRRHFGSVSRAAHRLLPARFLHDGRTLRQIFGTEGGWAGLVILCVVTVILLVVQNVVGILVASSVGAHPFYGLLIGSVSFVGGPGTAAPWAKEAQAMGLMHAPEVHWRRHARRRRGRLRIGSYYRLAHRADETARGGRPIACELGGARAAALGAGATDCNDHAGTTAHCGRGPRGRCSQRAGQGYGIGVARFPYGNARRSCYY